MTLAGGLLGGTVQLALTVSPMAYLCFSTSISGMPSGKPVKIYTVYTPSSRENVPCVTGFGGGGGELLSHMYTCTCPVGAFVRGLCVCIVDRVREKGCWNHASN